ncbi:hydrophobe/amphiphile efflux-3 (HAE3) family protein [Methanofollis sp. W23]|uniref:efflux RND transporter permease subunit n=1 Tax=Methanofollis sp. W23 TaxID=2817849 RepID=UPI001AE8F544|nr:hydrophobe/amphiphile efflux-3 (HAE3) family transporter [Methanofollis sp. W23]MBP2145726.1 hydrophobe/amphiphile efflux-3 (HAE3) family protein [Methanofollis sp. W23]
MFFERVASVLVRYPRQVALLLLCLFLLGIVGMTGVSMETGSDTYLDKSSREGVLYDSYTEHFLSDNAVLLVKCDDPLDPEFLSFLDRLETEVREVRHVDSAQGLPDVLKGINHGRLPGSRAEAEMLLGHLPADLKDRLLPSNILTLVLVDVEQGVSTDVSRGVLHSVQSVIESESPPAGVSIEVTGNTAFDEQMEDELSGSLAVLIVAAMGLMGVTLAVLFASMSHRLLPALLVAVGMILTFGVMGFAGINLNIGVVAAFPVLLGLGIDYAIQFQARLDEECRHSPLPEAVRTTIIRTGPAILVAMAATAMGFIAMFISPVPMVKSFGIVSLIGITCCYGVTLLGLPAYALLRNYTPKPAASGRAVEMKEKYDGVLSQIAGKIAKNPVPVLLVAAFVAYGGVVADSSIPIDTNQNTFVPPEMPTKLSLNEVTGMVGAVRPLPLLVQGEGVDDYETIVWMDRFGEYTLSRHPELTGVTSAATLIKKYNGGVLPSDQAGIDAALARVPQEELKGYLSGHTAGVIDLATIDMEMGAQDRVKKEVMADVGWMRPPPGIEVDPTGDYDMFTSLIANIAKSKAEMTYLGFALIFAYLVLVYRKRYAVSPIIPLVCIVGWNAVGMLVLGINYTPMTACLGSMTIGVASEYTILMMERYGEEMREHGDPQRAIREGVQKVGTAITVSGLVTACGFSALVLSNFQIIANFGVTTVIAVGFSLIGAIIIMPAALAVVGGGKKGVETEAQQDDAPSSTGGA